MLVERNERDSPHLKRFHNNNQGNRVQARDPGIGIHIGLPLVPPINLTLLPNVGNGAHTTPAPNPPAPTPTPAPTPQPVPTQPAPAPPSPTPGSSNPGGSSGGSDGGSNGGGGGNTGGSTGGNTGGSSGGDSGSQPAPATPSSSPSQGGSTTPPSPAGDGNSSTGNGSAGSDTGSGGTSGDTPSNPGSSDGSTGSGGSDGTTSPSNLGSSFQGGSSGGSDASGSGSSDGGGSASNAGGGGGGSGSVAHVGSGTSTLKGGHPSVTGSGTSPSGTDVGGGGGTGTTGATSGGHSHAAAIAIGVICAILFVLGLVFVLRRHRKARREQRAFVWWFTKKRTSQVYSDDRTQMIGQLPISGGFQSARSSFATNYDHAAQFEVNFAALPALPPMAEIRRSRNEFDYPMSSPSPSGEDHRFSLGSIGSHESQFFIVNHRPSIETSLDHRASTADPFGDPSHRFAFPRPPSESSSALLKSGDSDSSLSSRPVSRASLRTFATPDTSPSPPEHENLPAPRDPFANPDRLSARSSSSHTTNPFTDSTVSTSLSHDLASEEPMPMPVFKPYTSSVPDELTVEMGDRVKVLRLFDDGWALVDKLQPGSADIILERGLVPLGCLR